MSNTKENRTYAYMIRSELCVSTDDMVDFFDDVVCTIVEHKRKYVTISYMEDIKQLLTNYILYTLKSISSLEDEDELYDIIYDNIDIFFDISTDGDNIYNCEIENL